MPKGIYKRTKEQNRKIGAKSRERNLALGIIPPSRKGVVLTKEHKKKISIALKGRCVKGHRWTMEHRSWFSKYMKDKHLGKGLSPMNKIIRRSLEYKLWREAVYERDNWTCGWCGIKSRKGTKVELNPHHIKPFAQFPELRFAIDNGITLCRDCHKTTENYGPKARWRRQKWQ